MRCNEVRKLYSRRIDGELPAPDLAAFDAHLARCSACANDWRGFEAVVERIRSLKPVGLSDTGRARLRRALLEQAGAGQRSRLRLWKAWRPAAGIAAAAVFAFCVSLTIRLFSPDRLDEATTTRAVRALPNPAPELRLRDARTGGWVDADALAVALKRARRQVAVVPRIRAPLAEVENALHRHRARVLQALDAAGVGRDSVSFLTPVTVDSSLLAGPPVELWVEDIRPVAYVP